MSAKITGYVVADNNNEIIHGIGQTVDEAWAEVVEAAGTFHDAFGNEITADEAFEKGFKVFGASAALIARVKERGGAIDWYVIDGVACTMEEDEDGE